MGAYPPGISPQTIERHQARRCECGKPCETDCLLCGKPACDECSYSEFQGERRVCLRCSLLLAFATKRIQEQAG